MCYLLLFYMSINKQSFLFGCFVIEVCLRKIHFLYFPYNDVNQLSFEAGMEHFEILVLILIWMKVHHIHKK